MCEFRIGDKVRVIAVPPILLREDPIARADAEFFKLCLGKIFPVMGFDETHGDMELWATDKGNPRQGTRGGIHTIWIEAECVTLISRIDS